MLKSEYGFVKKNNASADVNMSSLIDLVFILLIFFVITAQFHENNSIDVKRPGAECASLKTGDPVLITITSKGAIYIFGKEVSKKTLLSIMKKEHSEQNELDVLIIGDKKCSLGKTVEVMDICSQVGIENISIAAQRQ